MGGRGGGCGEGTRDDANETARLVLLVSLRSSRGAGPASARTDLLHDASMQAFPEPDPASMSCDKRCRRRIELLRLISFKPSLDVVVLSILSISVCISVRISPSNASTRRSTCVLATRQPCRSTL